LSRHEDTHTKKEINPFKKSELEENLLELDAHHIIVLITARINNKEKWLLSSSPPFT
jgi:hypothetical protein|tara:strand:+ start:198 stop:368 length:171 start_codon:yes stop_codon:yes gene_type:complete